MTCIHDEFLEWWHVNKVSFQNDNEVKQYANAAFDNELTSVLLEMTARLT